MWKYYNPVEVVFGTGKLDELGQLMAERGLDRALVVSDPFTHRSGAAACWTSSLRWSPIPPVTT